MSSRDLDDWQRALEIADADLREREHQALQQDLSSQELRALAAERDKIADDWDALAGARDEAARRRDRAALGRDVRGSTRDRAAREYAQDRDAAAADRFLAGADRDFAAGDRADSVDDRRRAAEARQMSADARGRAADDRNAAATNADVMQQEIDGLRVALETRVQIGRAEGLLMARHGLDPESAFRLLTKLSQQSHAKLRDVAARLVADATAQAQSPVGKDAEPTT